MVRMLANGHLLLRRRFLGVSRGAFVTVWIIAAWWGCFSCAFSAVCSATQRRHTAGGWGTHFQP